MAKTKESLPGGVLQPSGLLHPGVAAQNPHKNNKVVNKWQKIISQKI